MTKWMLVLAGVVAVTGVVRPSLAQTQTTTSPSPLNGVWTLNRALSQFPKEIGFNIDIPTSSDEAPPPSSGGRGRRASGRTSGGPVVGRRESYEDGQRKQLMTNEARNPPSRLMFVDNGAAVTITNDLGQLRTIHPSGHQEPVEIQGIVFMVTSHRDGDRLIADFQVEQDREVRYTFSPSATTHQLSVDVELLERGSGDKATRVYDSGTGSDTVVSSRPAAGPPPPGIASEPPRENFDQRPGAEFKGLKDLGILVEDLGSEAQACGLKRDALEDSLSRRLSAGGLNVKRNSDEDTYVYVNIITTAMPNGSCISRYDAFLYTHATAKLTYREQPVLVQVSLMHRGGIATSGMASHAASVSRGLEGYVDLFISQIRDANK
ncbi:MAG TPA: hypothetical protein VLV86_11500 [Vicinamibacterales bacterium]|nr:hypothetical protein [Vicinamibacterales bacterium]